MALDRDKANDFEELALPLFAPLYNLAQWLTQDRSEAEDLVQETYAKALKGLDSFQPGDKLSRLDVSHPAQHISDVANWAEGSQDCAAR